jgi:signal peptidase II
VVEPYGQEGVSMPSHHRKYGFIIAAILFAADQLLKWVVLGPLNLVNEGAELYLLPFFQFTMTHNNGVALGMFGAETETARWVLTGLTAGIAAFVGYWMWREPAKGDVTGLALVLGGALGNITDRARFGYVVDFLDLHFGAFRPFLVFNLADAAITIGVLILLARAFLVRDPQKGPKAGMENDNA